MTEPAATVEFIPGEANPESTQHELRPGESTTFSTWCCGGTTTLWVENLGDEEGQVSVNAGGGHEYIHLNGKEKKYIQRQWEGIVIGVTNSGSTTVRVWTA
ncbi:MAG: hypothetical protein U0X20_29295 [Caldilineaceae bacterium]